MADSYAIYLIEISDKQTNKQTNNGILVVVHLFSYFLAIFIKNRLNEAFLLIRQTAYL